jgi:hypothetical protein
MRNILEATNTYKQRKTNSFSGKTVTNRHPLPCDYFNCNSSDPFSVAILPSGNNTATYFNKASGYKTLGSLIYCISSAQEKSRLSNSVEFISRLIALKIKTNKYYSYSGALTACCITHNKNNNIDCTITPESILKHEKESVNQVTACTLGEVSVIHVYPGEIFLMKHAQGIRPTRRGIN